MFCRVVTIINKRMILNPSTGVNYHDNAKRSLDRAELSLKHLAEFFKGAKIINITTNQVERNILKRKQEGAMNGTVKRELKEIENTHQNDFAGTNSGTILDVTAKG